MTIIETRLNKVRKENVIPQRNIYGAPRSFLHGPGIYSYARLNKERKGNVIAHREIYMVPLDHVYLELIFIVVQHWKQSQIL